LRRCLPRRWLGIDSRARPDLRLVWKRCPFSVTTVPRRTENTAFKGQLKLAWFSIQKIHELKKISLFSAIWFPSRSCKRYGRCQKHHMSSCIYLASFWPFEHPIRVLVFLLPSFLPSFFVRSFVRRWLSDIFFIKGHFVFRSHSRAASATATTAAQQPGLRSKEEGLYISCISTTAAATAAISTGRDPPYCQI
jgi:hypothetical protein